MRGLVFLLLALVLAGSPACGVKSDPIPYVDAYPEESAGAKQGPAPEPTAAEKKPQ